MSGTRTPPPSETSDQEIDSSRSVSEARLSGPPPKSPQTRGEQAVDTDGGMTMVYTTSEEALLKYCELDTESSYNLASRSPIRSLCSSMSHGILHRWSKAQLMFCRPFHPMHQEES